MNDSDIQAAAERHWPPVIADDNDGLEYLRSAMRGSFTVGARWAREQIAGEIDARFEAAPLGSDFQDGVKAGLWTAYRIVRVEVQP